MSVFNAAAQGSALALRRVVTVFHYPDHLRVAKRDLCPAVVRLSSPCVRAVTDGSSWLFQQDPLMPQLLTTVETHARLCP